MASTLDQILSHPLEMPTSGGATVMIKPSELIRMAADLLYMIADAQPAQPVQPPVPEAKPKTKLILPR